MQKVVVTDEVATKLKRFPSRVDLCDEQGNTVRIIERVVEASDSTESRVPEAEMLEVLHEVFPQA